MRCLNVAQCRYDLLVVEKKLGGPTFRVRWLCPTVIPSALPDCRCWARESVQQCLVLCLATRSLWMRTWTLICSQRVSRGDKKRVIAHREHRQRIGEERSTPSNVADRLFPLEVELQERGLLEQQVPGWRERSDELAQRLLHDLIHSCTPCGRSASVSAAMIKPLQFLTASPRIT